MATNKAIVLAAASVIIDDFTEENMLDVVDLVQSILTHKSKDARRGGLCNRRRTNLRQFHIQVTLSDA